MTKTTLNHISALSRKKYQIDASRYTLGRLAVAIARYLQGKHHVDYSPSSDSGDYVYVANVTQVKFTGRKFEQKSYTRFSGYPGGISRTKLSEMFAKTPEWVVRSAVAGMLPKNKLKKLRLRRLRFIEANNAGLKLDVIIN